MKKETIGSSSCLRGARVEYRTLKIHSSLHSVTCYIKSVKLVVQWVLKLNILKKNFVQVNKNIRIILFSGKPIFWLYIKVTVENILKRINQR